MNGMVRIKSLAVTANGSSVVVTPNVNRAMTVRAFLGTNTTDTNIRPIAKRVGDTNFSGGIFSAVFAKAFFHIAPNYFNIKKSKVNF
jgi:hypothetical protein